MYEGTKLWNSISNGIKTIENISKFKTLLKKWNGSLYIIMYIAVRGPEAGGNKLRTYRKIKQQCTTEPYVNIIIAKNIARLMQNLGAVLRRLKLKHVDMV